MWLFNSLPRYQKGYSSLVAMYCSIIILNLALGFFSFQRDTLRLHGEDILGMSRKSFQANGILLFWANSSDYIEQGLSEWQVELQDESYFVTYKSETGDQLAKERLVVAAVDHPEWGIIAGSRVSTEGLVVYLHGRIED